MKGMPASLIVAEVVNMSKGELVKTGHMISVATVLFNIVVCVRLMPVISYHKFTLGIFVYLFICSIWTLSVPNKIC